MLIIAKIWTIVTNLWSHVRLLGCRSALLRLYSPPPPHLPTPHPYGGAGIKPPRQTPVSSMNLSLNPTPLPLMASATLAPLAQRMMGTRGLMVIPVSLLFGGTAAFQTSLCGWKSLFSKTGHLFIFSHRLQCYSMLRFIDKLHYNYFWPVIHYKVIHYCN